MSEYVTVRGFVAKDPEARIESGKAFVVKFRLGSTRRRRTGPNNEWTDMGTNWFTITAFGELGRNVQCSVRKGEAVVVTGRLQINEWTKDDGNQGFGVEIVADGIGHDLRFGTANWVSTKQARRNDAETVDGEHVDPSTGEVGGGPADWGAADWPSETGDPDVPAAEEVVDPAA